MSDKVDLSRRKFLAGATCAVGAAGVCAGSIPFIASMLPSKAVEAAGLTTLMVTHNMQHAIDYGNRLIMLEAGQLKLSMDGEEKASLDVESLVERFHITDDKILLS